MTPFLVPKIPPPAPKPGGWTFSKHAQQRTYQMGLIRDDVIYVIQNATCTWQSNSRKYGEEQKVCFLDDISVVYNPERHIVITVLPRVQEDYVR